MATLPGPIAKKKINPFGRKGEDEAAASMRNDKVAKRKMVAIIDDDPSVLRGLKRVLDASHFTTKVYDSGETFLANVGAIDASCIVIDIHLGGISGIETRRRLKAMGSITPVIFMTAHDAPRVRREAMDAGCAAYLQKPFSGHALVDVIRNATSIAEIH